MNSKWGKNIILSLPIVVIALLFLVISYAAKQYSGQIQEIIRLYNFSAVLSYLVILIAAVVVVPLPINTMLIVPIATQAWGPLLAGLLSIVGWTIGAMISFVLARKYGRPFVTHLVSLDKIEIIEKRIPTANMFWSVVFLRIVLPVDLLSYALGLFTTMPTKQYFFATLIGVSPFAFLLAYAGVFSVGWQLVILGMAALVFLSSYLVVKKS